MPPVATSIAVGPTVSGFTGTLICATMCAFTGTFVLPFGGLSATTAGPVVCAPGPVVKVE